MKSMYSQLNQDLWVLSTLNNKRNGVFLDIGAFDGVNLSNTYLLESQYGWKGICIEANETTFKKLRNSRDCICVNELLAGEANKVITFQHLGELSFCKSMQNINNNINIADIKSQHPDLDVSTHNLKTNTLNNILTEYKIDEVIDYMSVDVEGMEYSILKTFDFEKYHVNTITVEHNAAHQGTVYRNSIYDLLTSKNFEFVKGNDNVQNWNEEHYYIEDFYVNKTIK